jgi:hypothetical protein
MKTSNPFIFAALKMSHVLDGPVLFDAVADRPPGEAPLTQDLNLRIGEYQRGVILAPR